MERPMSQHLYAIAADMERGGIVIERFCDNVSRYDGDQNLRIVLDKADAAVAHAVRLVFAAGDYARENRGA